MANIFNKVTLVQAFATLGERAYKAGKTVEISVYGGSALMLTFDWRISTRDVDAVFEADKTFVRSLAVEIARENEWDEDWLNDGVKGFLSKKDTSPEAKRLFGTFPSEDQPGLRVMVAQPEYMFAMKCRAMRVGGVDENADIDDIRRLAAGLGISTVEEAFDLLSGFYPVNLSTAENPVRAGRDFRHPYLRASRGGASSMSSLTRRPRTLHEVSRRTNYGEQPFDAAFREFLDVFYAEDDERRPAIALRPLHLDDTKDAYLAATAEHLARSYGLDVPPWSECHGQPLRKPFFAGGLQSLKGILTVQSPAAFRRRMLFVSQDALERPRRVQPGAALSRDETDPKQ